MKSSAILRSFSASGRLLALIFAGAILANATTITGPSWLHVNLSFMPFTYYDTSHSASSYGFSRECPAGASVRSCFQTILSNLRAQGVSGVRIFVPFCNSTSRALVGCGNAWNQVSTRARPGSTM